MADKMTKKDFFKKVSEGVINEEIKAKALEFYKKALADADKRSKAQTENKNANIALAKIIIGRMKGRTLACSEIFTLCRDIEEFTSPSKVSAVCRLAVEEGMMTVRDDYKVGGKGSKVKAYTAIAEETTENETTEDETEDETTEDETEDNPEW